MLGTDASVLRYLGILCQEQEWSGRTVLRPKAYGCKVLSDTELKNGEPKVYMFEVITSVARKQPSSCLAKDLFKGPRSYFRRWIVRLHGYHMIKEHQTRDKHINADSLRKKTEFYERLEEKQANQAEIKDGF